MNEDKMIFNLDFGKHSAAGYRKIKNEDVIGYYLPQNAEDLYLRGQMFLITDARGEEGSGEFSSKLVIQTVFQEYFESPWNGNLSGMLTNALQKANISIYQANINEGKQNYYSNSLICAVVHDHTLYLVSIGDCLVYMLRNNVLENLTKPDKNEIETNYPFADTRQPEISLPLLGAKDNISIDIKQKQIQTNDIILLFTRSIVEAIPEQDIPTFVNTSSLQQVCELVVQKSLETNYNEDASAVIFKVRGMKRLSIEDEEKSIEMPQEPDEPEDRQIVIKGVRYRSNRKDEQMEEPDIEIVDDFSQDRDFRHPVYKRTAPPVVKSSIFPTGKWLNYVIFFLLFFLLIYAAIKYIPPYVQSLKESPKVQQITPSDTLEYAIAQEQEFGDEIQDSLTIPIEEPQPGLNQDTTVVVVEETIEEQTPVSLKIAVVDGSKKSISLNSFNDELKGLYSSDRLTQVKSSYRIKNSVIIWRRTFDSLKSGEISKRIESLKTVFNRSFQIEPDVKPLDFTIVIGADFNMPNISDQYTGLPDTEDNYYIEILNGYRVAGSARKLGNRLHNQRYNEKKVIIVNYRNADKLNYNHSFSKCNASMTEDAEKFMDHFKLPKSVTNAPLFDIKILIGSDVAL
ncbi:protein phosphatase 2C domain-containing protein [candidate division KSB1 bacterium]|nr:protein phosphatase 2C domain-containing protein [candidate division KSB1 bacterium]MBL7092959.1 protein phosphatase 2C domain-containing protein [candidate division KSB1 bacterium]